MFGQPLLVSSLLVAVLAGAARARQRTARIIQLGVGPSALVLRASSSWRGTLAVALTVVVAGCLLGFRQANGIVRALHFALATCVLCGAIAGLINVRTIMAVGVLGLTYWVPKSPRR